MTTPTEKYAFERETINVFPPDGPGWKDAFRELYDFTVQLERENKALSVNAENLEIVRKQGDEARKGLRVLQDAIAETADDCEEGCDSFGHVERCKTYSVAAWLVQFHRERNEARDIAIKLLPLVGVLLGEHRYTPLARGCFKCDALADLPRWLRSEIEG